MQGLAIRTMSKAIYTTEPLGHFGLAFDALLALHLAHPPLPRHDGPPPAGALPRTAARTCPWSRWKTQCKHSSAREKLAANAERASIKYKQVEFMADEIGNTFKGVVSGFNERGMYVEIEENKCEGMVRLSDIPGDTFELDKDNYRIVGRGSKRIIQFGDVMEVVVKSANLLDRTIDFELVDNRPDSVKMREAEEKKARGGDARGYRGGSGGSKGGGGKSSGNNRRR